MNGQPTKILFYQASQHHQQASVVCNDATYQNTITSQCQSHLALKHHCMTFAGQGFLVLAKTLNHLNSVHRNTS